MDARQRLLDAARALDRNTARLSALAGGCAPVLESDEHAAAERMLAAQRAAVADVASALRQMEDAQRAGRQLLAQAEELLRPRPEPTVDSAAAALQSADIEVAPGRESVRTPSKLDFDAFPQTPTLEQLGLSRAVLDLVGEDRYRVRVAGPKRSLVARSGSSPALPRPCAETPGSSSSFGSSMSSLLTNPMLLDGQASDPQSRLSLVAHGPEDDSCMAGSPRAAAPGEVPRSAGPTTSPFGGASSTIFGGAAGRLSDALSVSTIAPSDAAPADFE